MADPAHASITEDLRRGTRLGDCELLLRIGRGGMATVWVARQHGATPGDARLVAVKAILPELAGDREFKKMFLDEGRLVQQIVHPNVVRVHAVQEIGGVMCMVMEWIEGDSLHALIAEAGKRRPIPPEMAVRMIADAAAGLHGAHEARDAAGNLLGVVHRDVSPHNILIGTDGAVKLVDFGVAKAMGRISDATSAGQLKGKFGYMSPEQAMAKPVDRRADVFALGIVLFELTTGRRLFRGEHDAETLHLVVSGQIPAPSSIEPGYPPELERIVLKALERDLSRRYQTAEELQKDLEAYLRESRIVVARQGLGHLLMKVLGERIEQRRRAVKATLKQLDAGLGGALLPPEAAPGEFGPVTASGLSAPAGTPEASVPSSPSTTRPQTVSTVTAPERRSHAGMLVGIGGLVVALVVVLFVAFRDRGGATVTTTVVTQAAPEPSATAAAAPPPPADSAVEEALPIEALPAARVPAAPRAQGPAPVPVHPGPTAPQGPAPKPAAPQPLPPKPTAGPGTLPRANPYE